MAAFTADYIESINSQWLRGVRGLDRSFRAVLAGQRSFSCDSFVHIPLLWVKDLQESVWIALVCLAYYHVPIKFLSFFLSSLELPENVWPLQQSEIFTAKALQHQQNRVKLLSVHNTGNINSIC